MAKITISFYHLYLLVKVHKSPVFVPSLGSADKLASRDLENLSLIEEKESRLFCTEEGNRLVCEFNNALRVEANIQAGFNKP